MHHSWFIRFLTCFVLLTRLQSCTVDEPPRTEPYEKGVLILEEGQAQQNNASVSFLPGGGTLVRDVFTSVNRRNLGDRLQSYAEIDGKGYLVVTNGDKVEIVEGSTFRSIAVLDKAVERPRFMVAAPPQNGLFLKGYVSCWGGKTRSSSVAIVSLADRKIIGQIPVIAGPEQMAVVGNELFVANSGGDNVGQLVTVINTTTDQVAGTIPVGDAPTAMVYDPAGGLLHVLCSGRPTTNGTTTAELIRIDPTTRRVVSRLVIGGRPIRGNPSNLILHERTLYFLVGGAAYTTPVDATTISLDKPLINDSLYGLGVDPATGLIYGADARGKASNGLVRRYRPNGTRLDSLTVGLMPNGFYFK